MLLAVKVLAVTGTFFLSAYYFNNLKGHSEPELLSSLPEDLQVYPLPVSADIEHQKNNSSLEERDLLLTIVHETVGIAESIIPPFLHQLPICYILHLMVYLYLMNSFGKMLCRFTRKKSVHLTRDGVMLKETLEKAQKKSFRNHAAELKAVKQVLNEYRRWYVLHTKECQQNNAVFEFLESRADKIDLDKCVGDVQEIGPLLWPKEYLLLVREVAKRDRKMLDMTVKLDFIQNSHQRLHNDLTRLLHDLPDVKQRHLLEEMLQRSNKNLKVAETWIIEDTDLYGANDNTTVEDELMRYFAI